MGFNTYPNNPFPPSTEQAGEDGSGGSGSVALEAIAPEFSTEAQYRAGDLVFYEGDLYRFDEDHESGAWDRSQVMGTNLSENMVMLPGDGLRRILHEFAVKLKTSGGLHFDENGAIYADHLPDYRLTENDTKQQWIDGSPIYAKTVNTPIAINAVDQWIATDITGIDTLVDYTIRMTREGAQVGNSFLGGIINVTVLNNTLNVLAHGLDVVDHFIVTSITAYYTKVTV